MLWGIFQGLLVALCCFGFAVLMAKLVFPAPKRMPRADTPALPPAETGALAQTLIQMAREHPGLTGVAPLRNGHEAFAARILLANAAVSSIDAIYYIWRADMTGHLMLKALHSAAERGVRVRLLLDDNGIDRLDALLASLDAHPNIEIRLYNPFNLRRFKRLSFVFDFMRLNHRMHNKAFTVDGRASILGGRNIGDEYFGTGINPLQIDLDVLAIGEIVPQITDDFDRYWNSKPVRCATEVLAQNNDHALITRALATFEADPQFSDYRAVLETSDVIAGLARGDLAFEWTSVVLVSDDPTINFSPAPRAKLFATRLMDAVGPIQSRFDSVTPYLVPSRAGVGALADLQKRGIVVRMLTNSLEATDVVAVHAGYSKRRPAMLRAGIQLFELRKEGAVDEVAKGVRRFGSSGSSLHAKTFAVDGARVFVGSFNFDPRSMLLNTEMGLLIESAAMAEALHSAFDQGLTEIAWRVEKRGLKIVWIDSPAGDVIRHEPGSTLRRRMTLRVVGVLPVEWLL